VDSETPSWETGGTIKLRRQYGNTRIAYYARSAYYVDEMIRFRLNELLKARGWSDYKLAQESGIGANVIGKYRRNLVRRPDLAIINKLCEALNCSAGELLEHVPTKKAKKR
jgi:putative transcriptional regulator